MSKFINIWLIHKIISTSGSQWIPRRKQVIFLSGKLIEKNVRNYLYNHFDGVRSELDNQLRIHTRQ